MSKRRNQEGSWKIRRRIIISALAFCAWTVIYVMFKTIGDGCNESRIGEAIITSAFFMAGGIIGSYVFGAVIEDNKLATLQHPRQDDEEGNVK